MGLLYNDRKGMWEEECMHLTPQFLSATPPAVVEAQTCECPFTRVGTQGDLTLTSKGTIPLLVGS